MTHLQYLYYKCIMNLKNKGIIHLKKITQIRERYVNRLVV
jgi:hypothetical protein